MRGFVFAGLAAICVVSGSSTAMAQPGGGFRGGFGGPGGGSSLELILRDENVRKELDIVEDQQKKLEELSEKSRQEMRSVFEGMRDVPEDQRRARFEELQGKIRERMEAITKQVDEVLLPQQKQRLKQIVVQARMRRQNTVDTLSSGDVAEALALTEEQKEKLRGMQKEIEDDFQQKLKKLQEEARSKFLDVLTPEQKAKWKELIGNPIEFSQQEGGRFGRGGPPGGTPPNN